MAAKFPTKSNLKAHADLLRQDEWVIDGYASAASAWERFAVAHTLVYIDLPLFTHYWWVTKHLLVLRRIQRVQERGRVWRGWHLRIGSRQTVLGERCAR